MYKSFLHTFCNQKKWPAPAYSSTKHGPDNMPHFFATVTVNGTSFASEVAALSAKEANNEAARVAFVKLGSADAPPPPPVVLNSSHGGVPGEGLQAVVETLQASGSAAVGKTIEIIRDKQHLCKNQLQAYLQKRRLPLPVYSTERDGPPHASRYKSTVTVEGNIYSSEGFFCTLKDAENSAAKAALASLSSNGGEEELCYKNLLQELTQKMCIFLPVYVTTRAGEVHAPAFVSTVEVNQQVFTGQVAKSKKLAEMSAAKVAYSYLQECYSSRTATDPGAASQEQERGLPTPEVDLVLLAHLDQNFQPKLHPVAASKEQQLVLSSSQADLGHPNQNIQPEFPVPSGKVGGTGAAEPSTLNPGSFSNITTGQILSPPLASPSLSNTAIAGTEPSVIHPIPNSTEVVENIPASHPPTPLAFIPSVTHAGVASDSSNQHQNGLTAGFPASSVHMPSATPPADDGSYLGINGLIRASIGLPNRIVIHPRNISLTYPTGSTVLPVSDNNWVAVSSSQSAK